MFLYSEEPGSSFTLNRVFFNGNSSAAGGGALSVAAAFCTISDSTFVSNSAASIGGAILLGRSIDMTILRSTFWGNQAVQRGSALSTIIASQNVTIEHSTFTQNTVTDSANLPAGAVYNNGTMSLLNTVIAGNFEQSTLHNRADLVTDAPEDLTTLGHNLIGNNSGADTTFPEGTHVNGDQVGTGASPLNAQLGALLDNGGPTPTSMPNENSPLVDHGSCPGEVADQRGYNNPETGLRPVVAGGGPAPHGIGDNCDIGAVELMAFPSDTFIRDGFESP
jgi:predicted outer membrane repeat protein